ncbi:hypothetical protein ACFLQ6_09025 [Thermoproteota archaeon]
MSKFSRRKFIYAGVGVAVAAAKSGRNSIGIEIDPYYWNLSKNHLNNTLPSMIAKRTLKFLR